MISSAPLISAIAGWLGRRAPLSKWPKAIARCSSALAIIGGLALAYWPYALERWILTAPPAKRQATLARGIQLSGVVSCSILCLLSVVLLTLSYLVLVERSRWRTPR